VVGAVRLFKPSFSFFFLGSLIEDLNTFVDRQEVIIGASSNRPKIICEIWNDNIDRVKENERAAIVGIYRVRMYTRVSIKTKAHIERKFAQSKFIEVNHIDIV
jgi:hypothetical protein